MVNLPEYIWLDKMLLGRKIRALVKTFPNYIVGLRSETSNGEEVEISVRNDRDPVWLLFI